MNIDVTGLEFIEGFTVPVYASRGGAARARGIAELTDKCLDWLGGLAELPAVPPLFVLNPDDWARIAAIPQYGLAHVNRTRIVMGQEQAGLWGELPARVWPDLPIAGRRRMESEYGTPPDLAPFADLVICHELTHLADLPGWLDDPGAGRRGWGAENPRLLWLSELFANIGLQGFVAEREPAALTALETAFSVIGGIAPRRWAFQRLDEMHDSAAAPGMDGTNYVWFEFRLQILAKRLWAAAGAAGFRRVNAILHGPVLPDEEIFAVLGEMDHAVADDLRRWQSGFAEYGDQA